MTADCELFEARDRGADESVTAEGELEAQQVLQGKHSDATTVLVGAISELQGEWWSLPMGHAPLELRCCA